MCQAYDAEWKYLAAQERKRADACGYGDCKNCGAPSTEHESHWPYRRATDRTSSPWKWCEGFVR